MHYGEVKLAMFMDDAYAITAHGIIWNYKGIKTIIHHDWLWKTHQFTTMRLFTVTEKSTGLALCRNCSTIASAIREAKMKLDNPEMYARAIKAIRERGTK